VITELAIASPGGEVSANAPESDHYSEWYDSYQF
jgi:hypothetical protein